MKIEEKVFDLYRAHVYVREIIGEGSDIVIFSRGELCDNPSVGGICRPGNLTGGDHKREPDWLWTYFSAPLPDSGKVKRNYSKYRDERGHHSIAAIATPTHVFVCATTRQNVSVRGAKAFAEAYRLQMEI